MTAPAPAGLDPGALDAATPEDEIAARVDALAAAGRGDLLVPLLEERHPLYRGRGGNQTLRIRGWALAALERAGLPEEAMPQVLSELESGREPYLVAAAARALRGLPRPRPEAVPYLLAAAANLRSCDDAVSFERYRPAWPAPERRTATDEVLETLGRCGAAARGAVGDLSARLADPDGAPGAAVRTAIERAIARIESDPGEPAGGCCRPPAAWRGVRRLDPVSRPGAPPLDAVLEDQGGTRLRFGDFFACGEPAVVVFFYTRCPNPEKCSLTVTRLAGLRRALAAAGLAGRVRTAAISYDPGHDLPGRLAVYGRNRGFAADGRNRLFRAVAGADALDRHFEPGVNYLGSIVNRHRIELYVLDGAGRIAASVTRLKWRDDEVVAMVRELCEPPAGGPARRRGAAGLGSTLLAAALVLLPKCPLCWAAYLSALSVAGARALPLAAGLPWVLGALLAVHLAALARGAPVRNGRRPLLLSAAGAAMVLAGTFAGVPLLGLAGLAAVAAGAALNSLPRRSLARLEALPGALARAVSGRLADAYLSFRQGLGQSATGS